MNKVHLMKACSRFQTRIEWISWSRDLYNQPTAAFPNKSPEVTELYRNLLIIKATSQASIKSLKQCLGGLQRDNVSNSSNSTNPTITEVKASVATPSVGAVATNLNTTSSSLDVGSS
ncbi:hypothetical protein ACTXT7_003073 [Hymenolepis weldensis]